MNENGNSRKRAKVTLVGDSCVGKTSIILQYCKGVFENQTETTIGSSFISVLEKTSTDLIELNVWDTAGQEKYQSIVPMYLRTSNAVIIVSSFDQIDSVKHLEYWKTLVYDTIKDIDNSLVFIAMNKRDLFSSEVNDEASRFAHENGFQYFQTTAKNHEDIQRLFSAVAEAISKSGIYQKSMSGYKPALSQPTQKKCMC